MKTTELVLTTLVWLAVAIALLFNVRNRPEAGGGQGFEKSFVTVLGSVTRTGVWVPVWGGWRRFG